MNKLSFFSPCNSHFLPTNISSNLHSCRIFRREISTLVNWNSPFFICFPNNFIFYHNITEKHTLNTFLFLRNLCIDYMTKITSNNFAGWSKNELINFWIEKSKEWEINNWSNSFNKLVEEQTEWITTMKREISTRTKLILKT